MLRAMPTPIAIAMLLWVSFEVLLGRSRRATDADDAASDAGSERWIWIVVMTSFILASFASRAGISSWGLSASLRSLVGCGLVVSGLALRWTAIRALGRLFTTNVAVREGHEIVQTGLYRHVRHPSYSGMLIAAAGCGFGMGTWLSLVLTLVPMSVALSYRVRIEEAVLEEAFGRRWRDYARRTHRFVPGLY